MMELRNFDELKPGHLSASAVTVGNFDGVHLGHRAIIGKVLEQARALEIPAAVITFDPHPRRVIYKGQSVPSILPFTERARLIAELGADLLVKVSFTPEFAARSAEWFLEKTVEKMNPRVVVIGHDFRFGKGRGGDHLFLVDAGARRKFTVIAVPAVEVSGKPVSSTRIRGLIQAGEMKRVRELLGAPFHLIGEVVRGHGRGRGLGFATANLRWENELIPPPGVYAGIAFFDERKLPAVINIGMKPTFQDAELSVEAHLIGLDEDLYGRGIRIALYRRLRGEIKFESPRTLASQIEKDIARARQELFAATGEDLFAGDKER